MVLRIIMEKNNTNNNQLTPAEIKKFKTMLLAKLTEILGNVTIMESEAFHRDRSDLSSMPIHMADLGTDSSEIDNIIGLVDSERKILIEINDALNRIENGTYGICQGRGEQIPKQRLKAIPWAQYCVTCATLLEKGHFVNKRYQESVRTFPEDSDDDD